MTENLRIWDAFGPTDPHHTKGFQRSGGFKGTSIKPIWAIKRMTELFGPMGIGWGYSTKREHIVPVPETKEILVFLLVQLWYIDPEKRAKFENRPEAKKEDIYHDISYIEQWGGDKICSLVKGEPRTSDEAIKGASTDGMLKCMSYIGLGSDIHMGLFDDAKYVRDAEKTWDTKAAENKPLREQILDNWKVIRAYWTKFQCEEDGNHPAAMKILVDKWTEGADNRESAILQGQQTYMKEFSITQ